MVRPNEDADTLHRCLDAGPQNKRQPNEEPQRVARPECAETSLAPYYFRFSDSARTTSALAEGISVRGNKAIEEPTDTPKQGALSECADQPSGREQPCQGR